jgi:serine/threonine protein kinase
MSTDFPPLILDLNRYENRTLIDKDSDKTIYSTIDKSTGQVVAFGEWPIPYCGFRQLARSIAVQWQMNLPGVVRIIGVSRIAQEDKEAPLVVVTEFVPHGNFDKLISDRLTSDNPSTFRPTTFSKIIFGIAATMSEIHSRSFLHRDLTRSNILLDEHDEPRIDGFYLARFYYNCDELTIGGWPLLYMAPEMFTGDLSCDNCIDVFSYGVLLHQIFTAKLEFSPGGLRIRSELHLLRVVVAGGRLCWQPEIPETFWKLITLCWKQEPEKRPSFHEITEMMLESDDLTFPGTDLDEYHEYQNRIIRETNDSPIRDPSVILKFLVDIGLDLESINGVTP